MPALPHPAALAAHAGRMHKLSGSAGMLGARGIQQLASKAETASKTTAHLPRSAPAGRSSSSKS